MKEAIKSLGKKIIKKINKETISVVHLSGVIGNVKGRGPSICFESVNPLLEKAFKAKPKAVAILINSPGGSPVQSELIGNRIRELSEEKEIPVYTFALDVAASGGYWLLCAGDRVYASNSSVVGSIGVISAGFGFTEAIKKMGIERRVHTQGENKSILDPFSPSKDEDVEIVKDVQYDIHRNFKAWVQFCREGKIDFDDKEVAKEVFSGKFWSGNKAQILGLVDEISDYRSAITEKYGRNVKFVDFSSKKGFFARTFGMETMCDSICERLLSAIISSKYKFF